MELAQIGANVKIIEIARGIEFRRIGLNPPNFSWHSPRDPLGQHLSHLLDIAATTARSDVVLMQR
jgi:hypothetical protein